MFLLLQTLAILLLIRDQHYQRSFFVHSANTLAGAAYNASADLRSYFSLRSVNEQLAEENTGLLQQTNASFLKTDRQVFEFQDTLYQRKFSYINAKIINNSVNRRNNFLTLNKGRRHGIEPDMGVITFNGIIGIVKNVSENFSSVISLLHSDTHISVRLKKNNHMGTLIWEGENYRETTLQYIPPHVELEIGDTVVTSGFSRIFPGEIMIGTISDYEIRRGDNFYTATIELAEDFNKLSFVHVVKNLMREELDELEENAFTTQ